MTQRDLILPYMTPDDPIWPKLNRRCPIKQAKIDKRKATREEHLKTWLNALGQKSNSLYSFDICDEPTTEAGFQKDVSLMALLNNEIILREILSSKLQFENPPEGKGITLEGFTISIHQHYIKEKGGLLRNDQWRIGVVFKSFWDVLVFILTQNIFLSMIHFRYEVSWMQFAL